jgi:hypothetical protein
LVSGAMMLTRPKVHATSGVVTTLAIIDARRSEASERRHPSSAGTISRRASAPLAMIPAIPATLS